MPYKIVIAGSTAASASCAETLAADPRFQVTAVLTPAPRKVGRHQTLVNNPLHTWAEARQKAALGDSTPHHCPIILIKHKIDLAIKTAILQLPPPDFLLVVDFGYFLPNWLLAWPQLAPLNIHPSALPKYRGASPGQFALLMGETTSAVSLMIPNAQLDQGDLLAQLPFSIDPDWGQKEYYQAAFTLINEKLADLIGDFAAGKITPQPQPLASPTPTARQLTKDDSFLDWTLLWLALAESQREFFRDLFLKYNPTSSPFPLMGMVSPNYDKNATNRPPISPDQPLSLLETQILPELFPHQIIDSRLKLHQSLPFQLNPITQTTPTDTSSPSSTSSTENTPINQTFSPPLPNHNPNLSSTFAPATLNFLRSKIDRAIKAFATWPEVWTLLPTTTLPQPLRLKLISSHYAPIPSQLTLHQIKLEGKNIQTLPP